MKNELSLDYLRNTEVFVSWYIPPNKFEIIGDLYYMHWFVYGLKRKAKLKQWRYSIHLPGDATPDDKEEALTRGRVEAWKQYKNMIKRRKFISIAPAIKIPGVWVGSVGFID